MDAQQIPIPSGALVSWPLDLTSASMIQIILAQLSLTQDYSLRAWISVYVNGIPLAPGYVPVMQTGGLPLVVYISPQTPPANTFAVPVSPGLYVLNVFNLTNEANVLGYLATTLA